MYMISVEYFDRRKRTKNFSLSFADFTSLKSWLAENGNTFYSVAMLWIGHDNFAMEYSDMLTAGLI